MGTKYKGTRSEVNTLNAYIKLIRAVDSISSRISGQLRKQSGLTISQFGVLETLLHLGPMCQSELCEKLLKSGGNIVFVIDNLEKRNLVQRRRSLKDRRFTTIHLTKDGDLFIRKIFPDHLNTIMNEMSPLTGVEKEELSRLCKKLGCRTEN